jgi:hypothetical protein
VLAAAGHELAEQQPLPELIDPPTQSVDEPSNEPLVPIAHRNIRMLANYFHAGWEKAQFGMWLREGAMERLGRVADNLPDLTTSVTAPRRILRAFTRR